MTRQTIAVLDYGAGNIQSIKSAINTFDVDVRVTNKAKEVQASDKLIIPGVGSFPAAMKKLHENQLKDIVTSFADSGKIILGICLGMQILMEIGEEFEITPGLGLIEGSVKALEKLKNPTTSRRIPNIGWYPIKPIGGQIGDEYSILKGINGLDSFYFVHSFVCVPKNKEEITSISNFHDLEFCSSFNKKNLYGLQFHPERSGSSGLQVLRNFTLL
jgi:imidazole glycerol-phosphate synthase subunit HisH